MWLGLLVISRIQKKRLENEIIILLIIAGLMNVILGLVIVPTLVKRG